MGFATTSRFFRAAVVAALTSALIFSFSSPASAVNTWSGQRVVFASLDPTKAISINSHKYRGSLVVESNGSVTNELSLDDYVKGISEVPNAWPEEALKAQAIAARTYVMWTLQNQDTICATTSCQVYSGVAKEDAELGERWAKAVDDTAGQVIEYGGKPIKAMYSSSNGGYEVAGSAPYLWARPDPDDAASPLHSWDYSVPIASLGGRFGFAGTTVGVASDVGGIRLTQAVGSKRETHVIDHVQLRGAINRDFAPPPGRSLPLPSARFEFSSSGSTLSIHGHGYGHGIGMSQYGALGKANRGLTANQILAAYYGGLTPSQIGTEPVRVELGSFGSSLSISAASPMKVSADGNVLAVASSASWSAHVGGGSVSVSTNETVATPEISAASVELSPSENNDGTLTFNLDKPAAISMKIVTPGTEVVKEVTNAGDFAVVGQGDATARAMIRNGVIPAGKVRIRIPNIKPGSYAAVIDASAGVGATSASKADFRIARDVAPDVLRLTVATPVRLTKIQSKRPVVIGALVFFVPWAFLTAGVVLPGRRSRRKQLRNTSRFVPYDHAD